MAIGPCKEWADARLGWRLRVNLLVLDEVEPEVKFSLVPDFPGCAEDIATGDVVWDMEHLIDSLQRPGKHWLFNCTCGVPDDADLYAPVVVSHPTARHIVWEIDCARNAPALSATTCSGAAIIRLTFERRQYEADVRAMLAAIEARMTTPMPFAELSGLRGAEHLTQLYPRLTATQEYCFEPPALNGDFLIDTLWALKARLSG